MSRSILVRTFIRLQVGTTRFCSGIPLELIRADGGWLASHSLPADRAVYGTFTELQDENRKVILDILQGKDEPALALLDEEDDEKRAEAANLKKLRTGYAACMDVVSRVPPFWQRYTDTSYVFRKASTRAALSRSYPSSTRSNVSSAHSTSRLTRPWLPLTRTTGRTPTPPTMYFPRS